MEGTQKHPQYPVGNIISLLTCSILDYNLTQQKRPVENHRWVERIAQEATMRKEFKDPEGISGWQPVSGLPQGASEIILYRDQDSGTYCRLLRVEPNFPGSEQPLKHDFDEVVYIIRGGIIDSLTGEVYRAGMVGLFPEGREHGPHTAPIGALMIEFRHYKPKPSSRSQ